MFDDETAPSTYDTSIERVVPAYTLLTAVFADLVDHVLKGASIGVPSILDLGTGTGQLIRVLSKKIHRGRFVGFDNSFPMLREYECWAKKQTAGSIVYQSIFGDIFDDSKWENHQYNLIISGYTLHHYPMPSRRRLYENIYNHLAQNGVFLNLDLYAYANPRVSNWAHDLELDWIHSQHLQPGYSERLSYGWIPESHTTLDSLEWLRHYQQENHLTTTVIQDEIELYNSGFLGIEIVCKVAQNALVIAEKCTRDVSTDGRGRIA